MIPDLVRAVKSGHEVKIRNPEAIRPWQHVLEPLSGYINLAEKLWNEDNYSSAWNFGPKNKDEKNAIIIINQ